MEKVLIIKQIYRVWVYKYSYFLLCIQFWCKFILWIDCVICGRISFIYITMSENCFSYAMARTSYSSMKWCPLCNRPTHNWIWVWLIVGSNAGQVKPKTIKLVCVASPLSTQHLREKAKTGGLGIRIIYPSWAAYLPTDSCFNEIAL